MNSLDVFGIAPVIPVVTLEEPGQAVSLARALHTGGIGVIELTLRTSSALKAIEVVATEVPEIVVGAGTITAAAHAGEAACAGAQFLVTPGSTERVLDAAEDTRLPMVPGAGTVSEAMRLAERGHTTLKFFPAKASGGVEFLQSVGTTLPELRFCPTGGIDAANAGEYLGLSNVSCVGGSWLTPKASVAACEFHAVTRLAHEATTLR